MKTTEMGMVYLKRLTQSGRRVESFAHLPDGVQGCVISPSGRGRGAVFVALKDGEILASNRINLIRPGWASDHERRAWCKLAGVSMTDLRRAIRTIRDDEKLAQKKRDVSRLRNEAARQGYKLVLA